MEIKKDYGLEKIGNRQVWETVYYNGKETCDLEELKNKVYRYKINALDLSKRLNKRIFLSIGIPSYFFGRASKNFIESTYKFLLSNSFWKDFEVLACHVSKTIKPNKLILDNSNDKLEEYHKTIDKIVDLVDKEIVHLTVNSEKYKLKGQNRTVLKIERLKLTISPKEKLFDGKLKVSCGDKDILIEI